MRQVRIPIPPACCATVAPTRPMARTRPGGMFIISILCKSACSRAAYTEHEQSEEATMPTHAADDAVGTRRVMPTARGRTPASGAFRPRRRGRKESTTARPRAALAGVPPEDAPPPPPLGRAHRSSAAAAAVGRSGRARGRAGGQERPGVTRAGNRAARAAEGRWGADSDPGLRGFVGGGVGAPSSCWDTWRGA